LDTVAYDIKQPYKSLIIFCRHFPRIHKD